MIALYITNFFQLVLNLLLYAIAVGYVLRLGTAILCKIKHTNIPTDNGPLFVFRSLVFLTLLALNLKATGLLDIYSYLHRAAFILLFCTVCSILKDILQYGGVRYLIDNFIDGFLSFVDNVKSIFEEVGNFFLLHPTVMYITLFLWGVGTSLVAQEYSESNRILIYNLTGFLAYCVYLSYALHSCRRLLLLLCVFALIYAIQVSLTIIEFSHLPNGISFLITIIVYVIIWMFTALVAEYEPVQMVFKIVNTFTTLAAILGNILIPVFSVEILPIETLLPGYDNMTVITIGFNMFILPLVAAGYLAQLAKDIYQYLKQHHTSVD